MKLLGLVRVGFLAFIFLVFFGFPFEKVLAQEPTPDPCAEITDTLPADPSLTNGVEFETEPPLGCIDEAKTRTVQVTLRGLTEDSGGYVICTGGNECLKEEGFIVGLNGPSLKDAFVGGNNPTTFTTNSNGELSVRVCGDGSKKVKVGEDTCPLNSSDNWFHGGNIYFLSVGLISDKAYYKPSAKGGFYVARSYPNVRVTPNSNITVSTPLVVSLSQTAQLLGGKSRNNFQIVLQGGEASINEQRCVTLDSAGSEISRSFGGLRTGKYIIKINEQNSEGGLRSDKCQGGFTYYHITCTVTNTSAAQKGSCTKVEDGKDPKGQEYRAFLDDLADLTKAGLSYKFPCGDGSRASVTDNPGNCKEINTAIGPIAITPEGFIESVFRIVLFLATFGGIVIIIYSGYALMTSQGDKEKIAGARETITAAIVGILFIVLSIVILEIIGVEVLRIPGFGR